MIAITLRALGIITDISKGQFQFKQYATIALNTPSSPSAEKVLFLLREHRWKELFELHSWRGDVDNLVIYMVELNGDQGVLLIFVNPYELYENTNFWAYERLTRSDMGVIKEAAHN